MMVIFIICIASRSGVFRRLTINYHRLTALPKERTKKLSNRRWTARCVVSVEILSIATQQCRNYLYDKS